MSKLPIWIGEKPESWSLSKLKYLVEINTGSKDTQDKKTNGKYNFYVRSATIEKIDVITNSGEAILTAGDGVGVGKVFHYVNGDYAVHQRVYIFNKFKNVLGKFLYYYLESNLKYEALNGNAKSTVDSLRKPLLNEFMVVYPNLFEQTLIVQYIERKTSEIDNLISLKEKQIQLLEEQLQSMITEAVTKGLNPDVKMKYSGVEWIGDIPEHWNLLRLKNVATVNTSNVDKKIKEDEHPIKLCNYTDVYYNKMITNEIDFMKSTAKEKQVAKFLLKKDQVILTKDSESPDDIGIPAYVAEDFSDVICGYHLSVLKPNNKVIFGKYLFYILCSKNFQEQLHSSANGVTRYGLNISAIENILVLLPSLKEQLNIADRLDIITLEINEVIAKNTNQIKKIKEYRQSLIHEAVTGKIPVEEMEKYLKEVEEDGN